jgi:hypothetical protein
MNKISWNKYKGLLDQINEFGFETKGLKLKVVPSEKKVFDQGKLPFCKIFLGDGFIGYFDFIADISKSDIDIIEWLIYEIDKVIDRIFLEWRK